MGGGGERLTVGHGKCLAVDLRLNDDEVNGEGGVAFAARPDAERVRTRARRTLPQNAFTRIW